MVSRGATTVAMMLMACGARSGWKHQVVHPRPERGQSRSSGQKLELVHADPVQSAFRDDDLNRIGLVYAIEGRVR